MPSLIDFHSGADGDFDWTPIHQAWSVLLASHLNAELPPGYEAWPGVMRRQEGDAVVLRSEHAWTEFDDSAVAAPSRVLSVGSSQTYAEVRITKFDDTLAGLVEIISPSNLDRPQSRGAICGKVEAALFDGVGVAWIDTVTTQTHGVNLHRLLLQSLGEPDPEADPIYAASYAKSPEHDELAVWYRRLKLEQPLPDLPITLKDGPTINLPLTASYAELFDRLPIGKRAAGGTTAATTIQGDGGTSSRADPDGTEA